MRKKLLLIVCLTSVMLFATSCGMETKMVINDDLTSSRTDSVYYSESEIKDLIEGEDITFEEFTEELTPVEIDGVMYYGETETEDNVSVADTKAEFTALNKNYVVFQVGTSDTKDALDEMGIDFMNYTVTLPKKVVKSNCTVLEDGKTVVLDKSDLSKLGALYAIYNKEAAKSKKVTYSGVTNGKIYKVKKYITINSPNVIQKVTITRNGKKYQDSEVYTVNGKDYDNLYNKFAFVKDGKYVVKTRLVNDALSTLKFTVDKTKPTTNMKAKAYKKTTNGKKITFKDATSGIKSATLNGKKIKNGKVVKKVGKYTLIITDKAGNKRTVKFSIKK